jgi:hypothetical protein
MCSNGLDLPALAALACQFKLVFQPTCLSPAVPQEAIDNTLATLRIFTRKETTL